MYRQAAFEAIRAQGWLSLQPEPFRSELLRGAEVMKVPRGATFQLAGEEPAGLFGLAAGSLSIFGGHHGLPNHLIHVAGPGWWFGDASLISGVGRKASIEAREDSLAVVVGRAAINRLAASDDLAWKRIAQITVGHLDLSLRIVAALGVADADRRVAFALARLTETLDPAQGDRVEVQVTQAELGELARMTRNAVLPVIRRLGAAGLLELGYGRIVVSSLTRLRAFLNPDAATAKR